MNRRDCLRLIAAGMASSSCAGARRLSSDPPPRKPNIIFILADDLGYADIGCFGSRVIQTPHLDRLAERGMRFTHFYAASGVCTPTRASCITGRYPLRFDITQHFKDGDENLPRDTVTLPKLLRQAGYSTAHVGKWHLGGLNKHQTENRAASIPGPLEHGFDHYLAMYEGPGIRGTLLQNRRLYRDGGHHLVRNDSPVEPVERHWTDYKIDESLELIDRYHHDDRPFFLNLWFDAPHTPYEPAPEPHLQPYKDKATGDDRLYRSMVSHLDAGVGRIVNKLDALGIAENTLILFTSDNGPSFQGSPGRYRGGKADLHEGGLRVPMMAVWPGRIPAGTESNFLAHTNDLLPTFCAASGVPLPPQVEFDGLSLLPLLAGEKIEEERGTLFWQLDTYKWYPQPGDKPEPFATEIARNGRWKLLARDGEPTELFDLDADPSETTDLLERRPEIVKRLAGELQAWLREPRHSWKTE